MLGKQPTGGKSKEESKSKLATTTTDAQKRFEFENEVIEEELYQFSEEETDRLFKDKPW